MAAGLVQLSTEMTTGQSRLFASQNSRGTWTAVFGASTTDTPARAASRSTGAIAVRMIVLALASATAVNKAEPVVTAIAAS